MIVYRDVYYLKLKAAIRTFLSRTPRSTRTASSETLP
jgi:hypothetical protein